MTVLGFCSILDLFLTLRYIIKFSFRIIMVYGEDNKKCKMEKMMKQRRDDRPS